MEDQQGRIWKGGIELYLFLSRETIDFERSPVTNLMKKIEPVHAIPNKKFQFRSVSPIFILRI
jgi:hypothetical protein